MAEEQQQQMEEVTSEEKTFTEDQVNEIVTKRLARVEKKYADYDDLKARLSEFETAEQERKDAELSEVERLQKQLAAKEDIEQSLAKQIEEIKAQAQRQQIENAFVKTATTSNIAYIEDALKLADLSNVKIDSEGKIEGIDDVIKTLVESKPFLLAPKQQVPVGVSSNGGIRSESKTSEQLLKEAEEKAKTSGRVEDRAAFAQLKRELNI